MDRSSAEAFAAGILLARWEGDTKAWTLFRALVEQGPEGLSHDDRDTLADLEAAAGGRVIELLRQKAEVTHG